MAATNVRRGERTTLVLAGGFPRSVHAIRLGEWYIHRAYGWGALQISHASGIGVTGYLRPVQAVRLLRALDREALPCPIPPAELQRLAELHHPWPERVLAWRDLVKPIRDRYAPHTPGGRTRIPDLPPSDRAP